MSSIKLGKEEVEEASYGCDNSVSLELVEQTEWTHSSPKCEEQTTIFKLGEKYYEWTQCRSGSPFTEWHHTDEYDTEAELNEVKQVDKVITVWESVS